jgi:membrane fusion protein (multidrug efflux system)
MFVREQIQEGVRQDAVLAPQQGVSHDQKGEPDALVVGPDDKVELRTLQIDRAIGDQWVVTTGLKAGDKIIVEGIQSAKPGSQVVAEEYQAPPTDKTVRQAGAPPHTAAE